MAWTHTNPYAVYLGWIRSTRDDRWLTRCLRPIGDAIEDSGREIDRLKPDDHEGYIDAVVGEETEVVEQLLGTAFVLCQTYITGVVSRIIGLHKLHDHQDSSTPLTTTGRKKPEIWAFGGKVGKTPYTGPEIINAFANYSKHGEEWGGSWEKLAETNHTVQIISACGAERGSTGNLRTGAKVLGNRKFSDTLKFAVVVSDWAKNLESSYQTELTHRGLLKSKPSTL